MTFPTPNQDLYVFLSEMGIVIEAYKLLETHTLIL